MATTGFGVEVRGLPIDSTTDGEAISQLNWSVVDSVVLRTLNDGREGDGWAIEYWSDGLQVSVDHGAIFSVDIPRHHGGSVHVQLQGWTLEKAAYFFLMGVLPLALPRLGLAPLHGAAFMLASSACLVLGDSGTGKTTMLSHGLQAGATFLADDACAVDRHGDLWPAPPCWASRDEAGVGLPDYLGKGIQLEDTTAPGPVEVGSIVVLDRVAGSELRVESLAPRDAMLMLIRHQRSPWLFTDPREQHARLAAVTELATRPLGCLRYDPDTHSPQDVFSALRSWTAEPGGRAVRRDPPWD